MAGLYNILAGTSQKKISDSGGSIFIIVIVQDNVLSDGEREVGGILKIDAKTAVKILQPVAANIFSVYQYRTGCDVIETQQQLDESGLAGAIFPTSTTVSLFLMVKLTWSRMRALVPGY